YVIPKGCFVVPFLSAVHLDENLYEGAITFNPWRWMDPLNQEKRNWRSSPFGGGARFCPGAELARLQIALFLHYFVTTYSILRYLRDIVMPIGTLCQSLPEPYDKWSGCCILEGTSHSVVTAASGDPTQGGSDVFLSFSSISEWLSNPNNLTG
ncbi:hypothetical protein HYC85_018475, partial [Camellia sinensis]